MSSSKFSYGIVRRENGLYMFKEYEYEENERGFLYAQEIDIQSRLKHKYINNICDVIKTEKNISTIISLGATTLKDYIKTYTKTTKNKIPIIYKLTQVFNFLHKNDVLNLNCDPEKILIKSFESGDPLLTDFSESFYSGMHLDYEFDFTKNKNNRVNYNAPEIIKFLIKGNKNLNKFYTPEADVWKFAILILEILLPNFFKQISISDFRENIVSNPNYFNTIFPDKISYISDNYKENICDLLCNTLSENPDNRLTFKQILLHPLFQEFQNLDCELETDDAYNQLLTKSPKDYSPDHRDIIKLIINLAQRSYQQHDVKTIFIACHIFDKTAKFYKDKSEDERISLGCASLWLASKFSCQHTISISNFVENVETIVEGVTFKNILNTELDIIQINKGIIYQSPLYDLCNNFSDINLSFYNIILSKDSSLYSNVDLEKWSDYAKSLYNYDETSKFVAIKDFIS